MIGGQLVGGIVQIFGHGQQIESDVVLMFADVGFSDLQGIAERLPDRVRKPVL